jgi:hypothetical protein
LARGDVNFKILESIGDGYTAKSVGGGGTDKGVCHAREVAHRACFCGTAFFVPNNPSLVKTLVGVGHGVGIRDSNSTVNAGASGTIFHGF